MAVFDGLVAYWKLDGDGADATGNGHAATPSGSTSYAAAKIGDGLTLSGGYATVPDHADLSFSGSAWTMTFWVYVTADLVDLVAKYNTFKVVKRSTFTRVYWSTDGTSLTNFFNGQQFPLNTWTFIAVRYDGTNLKCRVNDADLGVQATTPLYDSGNPLCFGYSSAGMTGAIDEVGVWNRALSDAECAELYNSGAGLTFTDPGVPPVVTAPDATGANGADLWVAVSATDSDGTISTLTAACVDGLGAAVPTSTHNLTGIGTATASMDVKLAAADADAGTYTLTVTATDNDGNSADDAATLTVSTVTASVSQGAVEVVSENTAAVQVSQAMAEVAWSSDAMCFAQVSQDAAEVAFESTASVQVSQDALEVVIALADGGDGDPHEPPTYVGAPHSLFYYDERDGRIYDLILPPRPATFPELTAAEVPDTALLALTGTPGTLVKNTAGWTIYHSVAPDPVDGGFRLADWNNGPLGTGTLHIDTDTTTLNDYIYYDLGAGNEVDLTSKTVVFEIYSGGNEKQIGSPLYLSLGELTPGETLVSFSINAANQEETKEVDLSSYTASTVNAVRYIGFQAAAAVEGVYWIKNLRIRAGVTGEKRYKIRDVRIQGWQNPVNTELRLPSTEAPPPYADDEVVEAGTVGSIVTLTRASLPPGLAEWEIWRTDDGVTGKYHYVGKVGEDHDRWQPETAHIAGDTVRPSTLDKGRSGSDQFYYTCTTAGTTGDRDSEPTWPTTPAATVTDGTVVWTLSDAAHKFSVLSYADDVVDIADNPVLKEMRVQVPTPASSVGIHEGRLVLYVKEPGEEDKREKTGHLWGSGRDDIANWFDWLPGEIPDLGDFVADGDGWCLPLGEAGEVVRMDPLGAWTGASYTGPLMLSTTAGWNVGLQGDTPFNTSVAYRRRGGCCGAYAGCRDTTGFVALADPDGNVTLWDWQMRPTLLSGPLEATLRDATDAQRLDWVLGYDARMLRLAVYAKDGGFYALDTRKDGQGDHAGWDQLGTDVFGVPRCMAARPGPDGYLETGRTAGTVWRLFDPDEDDAPFVYKARAITRPGKSLVPVRLFTHHAGTALYSVDRDATRVWTRRALTTGRPAVGLPQNKSGRTISVEMQSIAPWAGATVYAANSVVTSVDGTKWFSTVNGGTTGASEPSWVVTTAGVSTTTDGTVTWLYRGAYTAPVIYSVEAEVGEMWT